MSVDDDWKNLVPGLSTRTASSMPWTATAFERHASVGSSNDRRTLLSPARL